LVAIASVSVRHVGEAVDVDEPASLGVMFSDTDLEVAVS